MVIDTSAILAILLNEPDRRRFDEAIEADPMRLLAAPAYLETSMVLFGRRGDAGLNRLERMIGLAEIDVAPFTAQHAELARLAFLSFGKGRHPAGLNFGDCVSYALAKSTGEPLLFKGTDFGLTDIRSAV